MNSQGPWGPADIRLVWWLHSLRDMLEPAEMRKLLVIVAFTAAFNIGMYNGTDVKYYVSIDLSKVLNFEGTFVLYIVPRFY